MIAISYKDEERKQSQIDVNRSDDSHGGHLRIIGRTDQDIIVWNLLSSVNI